MNEPKTTVLAKATPSIPSKNGHVRTHRLPDQIHTGPRPNYQQRKMQLTVNHHHAPRSTAIIAGWIVLLIGFVIALIPGLGLSMMQGKRI